MNSVAVVLEKPTQLVLSEIALDPKGEDDVVVDIEWSGISTGTEKLLWSGNMPPFPGMGYPLVPGYESVGQVVDADSTSGLSAGDRVFVPGAQCYGEVRGLFGGAASRVVVPASRITQVDKELGEDAVLLALAATAQHAIAAGNGQLPELIVGHGILGRLLARLTVALGATPVVWETDETRAQGALGYSVLNPQDDERRDYAAIYDASGDSKILDTLISHLSPSGEIVLAGFYQDPLSFAFPPAFMREMRLRVAAEWKPEDLTTVLSHVRSGDLSLAGLITHRRSAADAPDAYRTAFDDPNCLKMILDWSAYS